LISEINLIKNTIGWEIFFEKIKKLWQEKRDSFEVSFVLEFFIVGFASLMKTVRLQTNLYILE
jgi:hypothetical protein